MDRRTLERFFKYVAVGAGNSCWIWVGSLSSAGYGRFRIGGARGRNVTAHRWLYEHVYGELPREIEVCHNCPTGDNPACVRFDHMFPGTHAENLADMARKGRHGAQGKRGRHAKFTDEQVIELRQRYESGESIAALATAFGVAVQTAYAAANGLSYERLANDAPVPARRGKARGMRQHSAKLTDEQVAEIRSLYVPIGQKGRIGLKRNERADGWTIKALADRYGVGLSQIHRIIRGQSRRG